MPSAAEDKEFVCRWLGDGDACGFWEPWYVSDERNADLVTRITARNERAAAQQTLALLRTEAAPTPANTRIGVRADGMQQTFSGDELDVLQPQDGKKMSYLVGWYAPDEIPVRLDEREAGIYRAVDARDAAVHTLRSGAPADESKLIVVERPAPVKLFLAADDRTIKVRPGLPDELEIIGVWDTLQSLHGRRSFC